MSKAIIVLISLAIATGVRGAVCPSNVLSTAFDFTLVTAFDGSDLKFCKALKAGDSCCDAATVNGFQTKTDDLLKELSDTVADRDTYLIESRNAILAMSTQIGSLQNTLKQVTDTLTKTLGAANLEQFTSLITEAFAPLTQISTVLANFGAFRANFSNYQVQRGNCVKQLVNLQAAAWCLACDPSATTKGIDGTSVNYGDTVTSNIQTACYNYLVLAQSQNAILPIFYAKDSIAKITETFSKLTSGGTLNIADLPNLTEDADIPNDPNELPVTMPTDCKSADDCDWLVDSLFHNGQINKALLEAGGIVGYDGHEGSEGGESSENNNESVRLLAGNSWAPAADEAGVSVTWENNPGKVSNTGALRFGVLAAVLAVFVTLF